MSIDHLSIVAIDDEPEILSIITSMITSFFKSHSMSCDIHSYSDGNDFLKQEGEGTYDLFFLDIEMPGIDGISLAKEIHARYPNSSIIFVSNREDKVFDTFEVKPYGFVRKNCFLNDITKTLSQYLVELGRKGTSCPTIVFESDGNQIKIDLDRLLFVECDKHNQTLHTKDGEYVIHYTMARLEETLANYGFRRVHKGFIVNLNEVKSILSDGVIMTDSSFIPINRKKITEFKHEFLKHQKIFGSNVIL